jgi:hypothetical protein
MLPTFLQAPYDPGQRDFPSPVLTLACPCYAYPVAAWLKSWPAYTPPDAGLHRISSALRESACSRLGVREPPWDRQVPRAPLPRAGVTAAREASGASWKGVTPSSSLVRAHAPDLLPSTRLRHRLAQVVLAGCCQPLLGTGPSRRYLCRSFLACLAPYSGCSQGAPTRCVPQDVGLPRVRTGSARRGIPTGDTDDSWECIAARKLNQIRNHLAHRLEPKDIDVKLQEFMQFISTSSKNRPSDEAVAAVGDLHWHIGALYLALAARFRYKPSWFI